MPPHGHPLLSGRRSQAVNGLDHLESLELGMTERQRAVLGCTGVRPPERLGARPGLEGRL